ncbi:MAG: hypothetical protein QNJ84_13120 [Alphaproteobacteria bacterium]|nr:hypothetical protein [Alphaproteobacteria bacterium]
MKDDRDPIEPDIQESQTKAAGEPINSASVSANPYAIPIAADMAVSMPPEATPLQAAATAKAAALGDIVDRIIAVLETENAMLSKPNSQALGPIVARKQAHFIEYEEWLKSNGDLRSVMAELPPDERAVLLDRAKRFDALLRENEVKLDAMVKSGEHIMGVISEVARRAAQPVRGYGAAGSINAASRTVAPVAVNGTY